MNYEYRCLKCEYKFELKRPMSECSEMGNCPECGAEGQRILSPFTWIWSGRAYRPDGSLREDKDYARVMNG